MTDDGNGVEQINAPVNLQIPLMLMLMANRPYTLDLLDSGALLYGIQMAARRIYSIRDFRHRNCQ